MPSKSLSRSSLLSFQKYSSLLAGNDPYIPFSSAYELLETEILTGDTASVTFSSLGSYSADYQHLQLRLMVKAAAGTPRRYGSLRLGTGGSVDSGSNYLHHKLFGNGSSVTSNTDLSETANILIPDIFPHSGETNVFGAIVIDILDPFESTKNTTVRGFGGYDAEVALFSGVWFNTASVTDISLAAGASFNVSIASGSRLSLYGLKAA